jgi:hypothetical protein
VSETGTKDWKVLAFRVGKTEPNPHGGEFQKYYVDFEGSPDTYWRRKAGDAPEAGRSYYGTIRQGDYGPIFKKEKPPEGDGSTHTAGSRNYGSSKGWQPDSERDPERVARISRSHAQEMALRYAAETDALTGLKEQPDPRATVPAFFWRLVDQFEMDVEEAAAQKAARAGGASTGNGSTAPLPPRSTPAPEQAIREATPADRQAAAQNANDDIPF